jgi:hypothetical protein
MVAKRNMRFNSCPVSGSPFPMPISSSPVHFLSLSFSVPVNLFCTFETSVRYRRFSWPATFIPRRSIRSHRRTLRSHTDSLSSNGAEIDLSIPRLDQLGLHFAWFRRKACRMSHSLSASSSARYISGKGLEEL